MNQRTRCNEILQVCYRKYVCPASLECVGDDSSEDPGLGMGYSSTEKSPRIRKAKTACMKVTIKQQFMVLQEENGKTT